MRRFLAILIVSVFVALIPHTAYALSSDKVRQIAKEITVIIDGCGAGSGVIFRHEGNVYSVLTAKHVVDDAKLTCLIITADGVRQDANPQFTVPVLGVDLAVLQFTSNNNYKLAEFGDSNQVKEDQVVYVAGAPGQSEVFSSRKLIVVDGRIVSIQPPNQDGYSLIYNNLTRKGMSGGAVLDENGKVIGIHGQGEDIDSNKFNTAIPINTFSVSQSASSHSSSAPSSAQSENQQTFDFWSVFKNIGTWLGSGFAILVFLWVLTVKNGVIKAVGLAIGLLIVGSFGWQKINKQAISNDGSAPAQVKPTKNSDQAAKLYKIGEQSYEQGDKNKAIEYFTQSLQLNSQNADAYVYRGLARYDLGDKEGAITDYDKALLINPNNATAYYNRGNARYEAGDKQEALADYDKALSIAPNDADAYIGRGNARSDLGDKEGAIADYDKALLINPNNANVYYSRGNARSALGDKQEALADYNKALSINPNYANAYIGRGNARSALGDKQGAIVDYNEALSINPNDANTYDNRGLARSELGDKEGAITDYSKAISINPNDGNAYYNRGLARSELGDKKSAIQDFKKAAELYKEQGRQSYYQDAINQLKKLSQ